MGNDWISIAPLALPDGSVIEGTFGVENADGVEAVMQLANGVLSLVDKGSVNRYDENTLLNTAPDIYNIFKGNYTGSLIISDYPMLRFNFANNVLTSVTC